VSILFTKLINIFLPLFSTDLGYTSLEVHSWYFRWRLTVPLDENKCGLIDFKEVGKKAYHLDHRTSMFSGLVKGDLSVEVSTKP
jgi:hypothetical protein